MQPHYPFISLQKTEDTGIKNQREATLKGDTFWQDITIWDLMRNGEITLDQIVSGYKDNLKYCFRLCRKTYRKYFLEEKSLRQIMEKRLGKNYILYHQ